MQGTQNGVATSMTRRTGIFFGWRVVGAAFVLAVLGWGIGFYGPPVYLQAIQENRGWPVALISTAVTTHFVIGAVVVANLPTLYMRFGVPVATKAGAISLAVGILGWASATAPWQLFVATLFSGAGWAAMGAAPVNAVVSPWFVRTRPAALSMAYNGASIGGVVFSPLWVAGISVLGFPLAAATIGVVMAVTMWVLADRLFSRTPQQMGLRPDGDARLTPVALVRSPAAQPRPGASLWHDLKFLTLSAGMALGLFAQIGLITHLFSLLVPALGAQRAALAMGLATGSAIAGRTLVGWVMPTDADRRVVASASYAVQITGSIVFILAAGSSVPLLFLGVVLFGVGIGNATSLPPLIAQLEFPENHVQRVVALAVAVAQAAYAFAPATFGLVREFAPHSTGTASSAAPGLFVAAAFAQGLAIGAFVLGRNRQRTVSKSAARATGPRRPRP